MPEQRPLQPMVRGQAVPLQPMEVHSGADANLWPVKNLALEQVTAPEGRDSVGSPHCCSSALGGLQHVGGIHIRAAREALHLGKDSSRRRFLEDCLL